MSGSAEEKKYLVRNKRARHDYFVEDTYEAGMVLMGSEVKSLREAKGVLSDAYVQITRGEAWLLNMQITEYPWANRWNHAPKRERKLLLHRREIERIAEATEREGYTALPLDVYLKEGKIKVVVGICKGKKQHDKREAAKERAVKREIDSTLKRIKRSS